MRYIQEKHKPILLAILLIFIAIAPTLPYYYFGEKVMFQNHDNLAHLVRLWHIENALAQGVIVPTWLTSLTGELGSPLFIYNWFLPYYLGVPLRWLGLSLADSIKGLILAAHVVSGITIYLLARNVVGRSSALISIPFYLLNPYKLNVIFTRGGVGEALALAILPLVFLLAFSKRIISSYALTGALVILTLTHNVMAVVTYGLLGLWMLFTNSLAEKKKVFISIIVSLSLTAFFWIPALVERNLTHFEVAQEWYHQQFPSLRALLTSPWQYGPPQPERQHLSMSFQIGKIHWLIIAATPLLWFKRHKLRKHEKRVVFFLFVALFLSIVLQLKISKPVWDSVLPLRMIIFPWRLQAVTVFTIALLAALIAEKYPRARLVVAGSIILLLVANRNHFYTARGDYAADEHIKSLVHAGDSSGEFLPKWVNIEEYRRFAREQAIPRNGIFQENYGINLFDKKITPNEIHLDVETEKTREIVINHYYFPTWKGTIDGKDAAISPRNGRISFLLPSGRHSVILRFGQSPLRRFASFFSAASLATIIVSELYLRKRKVKERV